MSEQFWSDERVMGRYRDFVECNGAEYAEIAWQSVIREMRDEYEAALDGATGDGLDMLHRRIDKLADRIAMLERVRWVEEGEL